jgi:predicted esterase
MTQNTLHQKMPVAHYGATIEKAAAAMIMVHGRGATAQDILYLTHEFRAPRVAFIAPQAANNTWYPNRFVAPVATNEPWLSSALHVLDDLIASLVGAGMTRERIFLLGFSQGGCLATEYAARNPRRYAGVIGLSAGLIENGDQPRTYAGSLEGTPVLLGCSDVDFHIPVTRVERTAELFKELGAAVDLRIYPGMGHTVNQDEIEAIQHLLDSAV